MRDKHIHLNYFIIETFILGIGFFLIYSLLPSYNPQAFALAMLLIIYSIMGVSHHILEHDMKPKIMIEYILISVLVFAVFTFLKSGTL
ncbi:MAG: hypothetical protein ACM3IJ_02975 [Candidatus Levyibacteriota bacterium]